MDCIVYFITANIDKIDSIKLWFLIDVEKNQVFD